VYGLTHHHEIVALDSDGEPSLEQDQFSLQFGWRSYYNLAVRILQSRKFVRYQTLTYLTFYKDGERAGRLFEMWSGAYL
jgi:hypothetical protein